MQRLDRRYTTATGATGAGVLIGGITVTSVADEDGVSGDTLAIILTVVCVTVVALTSMRRWLIHYEAETKASLGALAAGHGDRTAVLDQREKDLYQREQALRQRAAEVDQQHMAVRGREHLVQLREQALADRITQIVNARRAEQQADQQARAEFQASYEELAREHDALVRQVITEGVMRFTGPPGPPADGSRMRALAHPQDPSPFSPVAEFRPRERHESV